MSMKFCKEPYHLGGTNCEACKLIERHGPYANPPAPIASDERDAEEWINPTGHDCNNEDCQLSGCIGVRAFLAGRKGMVPAAEVERLKQHLESTAIGMMRGREKDVAEAIKAERERIGFAILPLLTQAEDIDFNESNYDAGWVSALHAIQSLLNPSEEGK